MIKKCEQCGVEYSDYPNRRKRFCSNACKGLFSSGKKRPSWVGKLVTIAKTGIKRTAPITDQERINRRNGAIKAGLRPPSAKGRKATLETRIKESKLHMGEKNPQWKGGVSPKNKLIRGSFIYKIWRESVFLRDNWTCQKCKKRGEYIHPHHIKNFSDNIDVRFAIDNGITLCKKCHNVFHKEYGRKKNTKEQIVDFCKLGFI